MKNKNIKETINKLRKKIIELLKDGAKSAADYLIALLIVLLEFIKVSLIGFVLTASIYGIFEIRNYIVDVANAFNSQIQDGTVLETKTHTSFVKNKKVLTLDKIIIDSNHNGIKDADDIAIKGEDMSFTEIKEGDTLLFLNQKKNDKEEYLPLAVIGNENDDVNIIKMPSGYYKKAETQGKKLDNELANIIVSKVTEKAPR